MPKSEYITDVYFAAVQADVSGTVTPPARQQQLDETANPTLRSQRYYAWKLLEYALRRSFGYAMEDLAFHCDEHGKWHCAKCEFSLSHCDGAVAVAVSRKPVGVDLERADRPFSPALLERVLTESERTAYAALAEGDKQRFAVTHWCAKESLFKADDEAVFHPERYAMNEQVVTGTVTIGEAEYAYAVATPDPTALRIYKDIPL